MKPLQGKQGSRGPTPARRTAFQILLRVETESSFASELLVGPLAAKLDERDASLATEIVMGTLRWQAALDFIAQRYTKRWDALDAEVRVALRMGLYQLWFLCRVPGRMPARAALYETVEVAKTSGKRSAAGLINAVLRKTLENDCTQETDSADTVPECVAQALAPMRPASMSEIEWLAIECSHPAWLLARWIAQLGRERARAVARADNRHPATFLLMNPASRDSGEIERELAAERIELGPGKLLTRSRTLRSGNLVRTEIFRGGEVAIQDEASQAVPLLLDVRDGHRVLDLCAAPGNKTRQLAQAAGSQGMVVAGDIHLHRLSKMTGKGVGRGESFGTNVGSNVCENVSRIVLDGERELPFAKLFDRILVDAPCSGTGTLGRHPEIKWRLRPDDIRALAEKQLRLLRNAAAVLAHGGRMVYSVCSLEEEEGREVAQKFLAEQQDFRLLPLREDATRLRPFFLSQAARILEGDYFMTDPARDGVDGFFGAIFENVRS